MKIAIDLSESELRRLSELTDADIDPEDPDSEDVAYAIRILLYNC